jgi:diaminohydroxyphosphoribosylaminopyrimidine deaminase/5-amino-6-(5-phosphoribosylamino)uracil reductase
LDPNPRVFGQGAAELREAGVAVTIGLCAEDAREIIAPFAQHITTGRPRVTLKYAMTLDGRIATRCGESRWISSPASRQAAHAIRNITDAILVGAGTVIADDPALTTRLEGTADLRHPLRVVLDSHGRVPLGAQLFDPALPGRTLVATVDMPAERMRSLEARGIEVLHLPAAADGRVALPELLDVLGAREVTDLLVEGGAAVHGSFIDQGLAQAVCVFIAPKLVGGQSAPGPVGGIGVARMDAALTLTRMKVTATGEDLMITGDLDWAGGSARADERVQADTSNGTDDPDRSGELERAGFGDQSRRG